MFKMERKSSYVLNVSLQGQTLQKSYLLPSLWLEISQMSPIHFHLSTTTSLKLYMLTQTTVFEEETRESKSEEEAFSLLTSLQNATSGPFKLKSA